MTPIIRQFRCRTDNFAVLVFDPRTRATLAIDAPDASAIHGELNANGWRLTDILVTHHHADHTAGIDELVADTSCRVIAAQHGPIAEATVRVGDGDVVTVGALAATVLATPGHTRDHLSFWFQDLDAVFTGDTLFSLGCGRLFEGTAPEMWASLVKLRALPDHTALYCGHDYTAANARFALTVEPDNAALKARAAEVERLVAEGRPTLPTTLGREKAANPFLRADRPEVAAAAGLPGAPAAEVFAEIRRRKDSFR